MGSLRLMGRRSVWPLVACVVLLVGLCSATDLRTSNGQTDSGAAAVVGAQGGGKEEALPTAQQQQQQQQADQDPATDKGKDDDKRKRHRDSDKKRKNTDKASDSSSSNSRHRKKPKSDDSLPVGIDSLRSLQRTLHRSDCAVLRKGSIKVMCVPNDMQGEALVFIREAAGDSYGAQSKLELEMNMIAALDNRAPGTPLVRVNDYVPVFRFKEDVAGKLYYAWGMWEDYVDSGDPLVDHSFKLGPGMLWKMPYIWCELRRDESGKRILPKTFDQLTAEDNCSREKLEHTLDSLARLTTPSRSKIGVQDFQVVTKADGALVLFDPEGLHADPVKQLQTLTDLIQQVQALKDRLYPPPATTSPPVTPKEKKEKKGFFSSVFGGKK